MIEYTPNISFWGFWEDNNIKPSYQIEFADIIYYSLKSKGKAFKIHYNCGYEKYDQPGEFPAFDYEYVGFFKKKIIPRSYDDIIKAKSKKYNLGDCLIDINKLSNYIYRYSNIDCYSFNNDQGYYYMNAFIDAWRKEFNLSIEASTSRVTIILNEIESNKIYNKGLNMVRRNDFYDYCLEYHGGLLDKIVNEIIKKSEHLAINKEGVYYRGGLYENAGREMKIQKNLWHRKLFSEFNLKNLDSNDQVIGLSLALMRLVENDFDVLNYFDKGTFLMWISKKEKPNKIVESVRVEPIKLNEW